jgi:phosphoribosylglycinamide formyltransferase-1
VILISGRGSNMESILKSVKRDKKLPIDSILVISNKINAKGLKIAQKFGAKTIVVESKGFKGSREEYDKKIITVLDENKITAKNGLICLAGFMRVLGPKFVKRFRYRILNIHPALLPAFPGLDAQKQAIDYGVKYTGCTVHFVDDGVDTGPIILQKVVSIQDGDTIESLSNRILKQEHVIYPKAVKLFVTGKIRIVGRRVKIS